MADIPADILIYAVVAAGLVFWLRSVLGTRHGDERERPNPFVTSGDNNNDELKPVSAISDQSDVELDIHDTYDSFQDENIILNQGIAEGLRNIGRIDRNFDPATFIRGAEDAFILIVEAFSAGDRETLKNLLAPAVFEGFEREIKRREDKGERVITEIQAIRQAKIIDSTIKNKDVFVSVEFHAEETCVIEDRAGERIAGNANRATSMIDIWTFGRNVRSKDPTWFLYETRDGDPEDHKTPIPDAGSTN